MKNRTILGILCMVLAVAVMFGVAPIVNKLSASKINIVRVAMDVPKGHQITDKDITMVTVGGFNLPADVLKDTKAVVGKYATCDLKAEDYILPAKIKETADNSDDVFRTLDGKELAMSIAIPSFAGGLSGKLSCNNSFMRSPMVFQSLNKTVVRIFQSSRWKKQRNPSS